MSDFFREAETFLGSSHLVTAMRNNLAVALCNLEEAAVVGSTPLFEELFGYERDETIGLKVETFIPEEFRIRHEQLVVQYKSDPKIILMGDRRLPGQRKDGSQFTMTIWLLPVDDNQCLVVIFK